MRASLRRGSPGRGIRYHGGIVSVIYWYRSTVAGSTRVARMAGMHAATMATRARTAIPTNNVAGSLGDTLNKTAESARPAPRAASSPTAIPVVTVTITARKTIQTTPAPPAPSAIRIPISFVRSPTANATTA